MKRTRSIILVATLLFSMVVVLTSTVLAVTNDELNNYDSFYDDPVDMSQDMGNPAWYGVITADTGEVMSGCKVELFKKTQSSQGWWKLGENTIDQSGAYLIVLHKSIILKGHYVMRISDGSTGEIYERDISDSKSGDWGYGVPIEEMWGCPWSQTTDSQATDDRTTITKFVSWVTAFFTGETSETSTTDETPPPTTTTTTTQTTATQTTATQTTATQTTATQTTATQTTDDRTIVTKVVNWVAAFFTGGTSETSASDVTLSISSTGSSGEIPEFPTLAIPVVVLLGLFIFYRRKQKK
ncbi:MAG: PEF-CTERM sorting domain-containing protein [Methanosarcinales archaeon]|nr:MAG: PEF-CTERM sorting domain-containing protein [Methanosarcinales archaeon]